MCRAGYDYIPNFRNFLTTTFNSRCLTAIAQLGWILAKNQDFGQNQDFCTNYRKCILCLNKFYTSMRYVNLFIFIALNESLHTVHIAKSWHNLVIVNKAQTDMEKVVMLLQYNCWFQKISAILCSKIRKKVSLYTYLKSCYPFFSCSTNIWYFYLILFPIYTFLFSY